MALLLYDVSVGEPIAEPRGHHRRITEDPDLSTMGVPGQRQGHARWYARKNVRFVRQQNYGRWIRDLRERARQIVDALEAAPAAGAPAANEGELVPEPGQPKGLPRLGEAHDGILIDGNANLFQHAPALHGPGQPALGAEVIPPIVIAEYGMHAERGAELAQGLGPILRRDAARLEFVACRKVTQEHDRVGPKRVRHLNDRLDPPQRHCRTAGVQVGNDGDL